MTAEWIAYIGDAPTPGARFLRERDKQRWTSTPRWATTFATKREALYAVATRVERERMADHYGAERRDRLEVSIFPPDPPRGAVTDYILSNVLRQDEPGFLPPEILFMSDGNLHEIDRLDEFREVAVRFGSEDAMRPGLVEAEAILRTALEEVRSLLARLDES